jgi:hypothetical protein
MISEECDLDQFIEAITDMYYPEFYISILKEGYASDDVLVHKKRDGASEEVIQIVSEYNKALHDFLFLLNTSQRPDHASEKEMINYNKFRQVAQNLVDKGELLPEILNFFDD